jgi:hypothetical protein
MAREKPQQLRQLIAQRAAKMMAEEGISDFAYAKKKAGRQVGEVDNNALPSNAEIEQALKLYNALFLSDEQPERLLNMRKSALFTMQLLERFDPYLTGAVLDGSAGLGAETDIHLFADSLKDVEMFLLNKDIPFETDDEPNRVTNETKRDKKVASRKKIPVFSLETDSGVIKLSVFAVDEIRVATKRAADGSGAQRAGIEHVKLLLKR